MRHRFVPAAAWTDPRHRRGLWGERVALAFLSGCGWVMEAHRFRLGRHDLDLVVRRGRIVAFVEVKTRATHARGAPLESVTVRQRRRLARVAELWRVRYGRRGDEYRFDVVGVWAGGGGVRVEHVPDAWRL